MADIKDFDGIRNADFWVGIFSPGIDNKQRGSRNFLADGDDWIIDSYVQSIYYYVYSTLIGFTYKYKKFSVSHVYLDLRLGYGIPGFDRPTGISGDLCLPDSVNDNFDKEVETVFRLNIRESSDTLDIEAKPWGDYNDLTFDTAGFICEKEGSYKINFG